jgi:fatty-acid peroxygenase
LIAVESLTARIVMPQLPRLPGLDQSRAFLRQGYGFIPATCDRLGTDGFRARLMLRDVICLRGPEAVALVYSDAVTRKGSVPGTALRLLQDRHSVQQQDDADHHHRKALFIRMLMEQGSVTALQAEFREALRVALKDWSQKTEIVLIEAINPVLTRAVCRWAGLSGVAQPRHLADTLYRMSDRAGSFGPATLLALWRRRGVESWLRGLVAGARAGTVPVEPDTPFAHLLGHRDLSDMPLDAATLAVELLNILRPVVAIGRYITFAVLYLHRQPNWAARFQAGEFALLDPFVEEVRRIAPFFPAVGAVTTRPIVWKGNSIPSGQWLLCDLFGTLHDVRWFPAPETFDPDRGLSWQSEDNSFVPQGGGPVARSHRCPGEAITVALMAEAVRQIALGPPCSLPRQNLSVALDRIPARPASGLRLRFSASG